MRSRWLMYHGPHFERWSKHAIRIAQDNVTRYDLFSNQDDVTSCKHGFFTYPKATPKMGIALYVAALYLDNCHIGLYSRYE